MHNIRPAGQLWPAEAFNLALTAKILFFSLVCFIETQLEGVKPYHFWPLNIAKRNFWPAMRFELCTHALAPKPENFLNFPVLFVIYHSQSKNKEKNVTSKL